MGGQLDNSKNVKMMRVGCLVAFVLLQIFPIVSGLFGMAPFNGVATAFQYGICLIIIKSDEKKDIKLAIILMAINAVFTAAAMIVRPPLNILPGVVNIAFYIITLIMISNENKRREIENLTDMLTGVYNRRGLFKMLDRKVGAHEPFHLIYFTLDNFKAINDNYGPVFGDDLLQKVANRMNQMLGGDAIIARTAGTDFAVVVDGGVDAAQTAKQILQKVKEKYQLEVNDVRIDCFVESHAGIASYPEHSTKDSDIITYADIAMMEAIQQKSEIAVVFEPRMADAVYRQIEVEKLIKDALEKNYFYLVYQPQYSLDGKRLRGFEALLRLKNPDGTFVGPAEFIPVAEKGDLILHIDKYVIGRAMREFRQIVEDNPELVVSINVSAKNIGKENFVGTIRKLLQENEFPAKNLEIEITEYCMVNSIHVTKANITALKEMGVQIALDDFGTGYTSLSYLSELPITLLKIDKSLVDDIESDDKRRKFAHAIIEMGHLMNCEVMSEGVELDTQVEFLRQDGCDYIQGFVWGKPLEYEVAKKLSYESNLK